MTRARRATRALVGLAVAALVAAPAVASAGEELVRDAEARVADLDPRVHDLEPRVVDIAPVAADGQLVVGSDVLFAYDSAELMASAEDVLAGVADALAAGPAGTVLVVGHTDSDGSDEYNLDLSRRRAEAVRDHLAAVVGRGDLTWEVDGRGEDEPVADNGTPEGRQQNRRATVTLPG